MSEVIAIWGLAVVVPSLVWIGGMIHMEYGMWRSLQPGSACDQFEKDERDHLAQCEFERIQRKTRIQC